jgi:hypothetical protein
VFDALRRVAGQMFLAMYFALAPSTVPDWRADPSLRTVAMLAVGEPALPFVRRSLPLPDLDSPVRPTD